MPEHLHHRAAGQAGDAFVERAGLHREVGGVGGAVGGDGGVEGNPGVAELDLGT